MGSQAGAGGLACLWGPQHVGTDRWGRGGVQGGGEAGVKKRTPLHQLGLRALVSGPPVLSRGAVSVPQGTRAIPRSLCGGRTERGIRCGETRDPAGHRAVRGTPRPARRRCRRGREPCPPAPGRRLGRRLPRPRGGPASRSAALPRGPFFWLELFSGCGGVLPASRSVRGAAARPRPPGAPGSRALCGRRPSGRRDCSPDGGVAGPPAMHLGSRRFARRTGAEGFSVAGLDAPRGEGRPQCGASLGRT